MNLAKLALVFLLPSLMFCARPAGAEEKNQDGVNRCGGSAVDTSAIATAPDFTLKSLDGKEYSLAELTLNSVVLINFWATWCPTCVKEIPLLNGLDKKYGKKGLRSIAVNYKDSEKKLKGFLKKNPFKFPVLLDRDGSVTEDMYGLFGLPATIVVDMGGSIVYSSPEPPTEREIEEILAKCQPKAEEAASGGEEEKYGLKTGAKAPGFSVKTFDDKTFDLKSALKKGPVVLVFYRGGWCPYCSTQLRELRENLKKFEKRGATLAALSVDSVENTKKTFRKEKLGFPLLSDPDAKTLEKYRLTLKLDDKTLKQYSGYGIDIEKASGRKHHQIAVPAVFVIDTEGVIRWSYVNEDYKVRAKVEDILKALDAIK